MRRVDGWNERPRRGLDPIRGRVTRQPLRTGERQRDYSGVAPASRRSPRRYGTVGLAWLKRDRRKPDTGPSTHAAYVSVEQLRGWAAEGVPFDVIDQETGAHIRGVLLAQRSRFGDAGPDAPPGCDLRAEPQGIDAGLIPQRRCTQQPITQSLEARLHHLGERPRAMTDAVFGVR
jgi:hypothetical protein